MLRNLQSSLAARPQTEAPTRQTLADLGQVLHNLAAVADAPGNVPPGPPRGGAPPSQPAFPPPATAAQPTLTRPVASQLPPLVQPSTNTLKVTRFWQWPPELVSDPDMRIGASGAIFREGRLWIVVECKSFDFTLLRACLFAINLSDLSHETIELAVTQDKSARAASPSAGDYLAVESFEVSGGNVFINYGDHIKRWSPTTKTWTDLPVPVAGHLSLLDGRLFVTTDDTTSWRFRPTAIPRPSSPAPAASPR